MRVALIAHITVRKCAKNLSIDSFKYFKIALLQKYENIILVEINYSKLEF